MEGADRSIGRQGAQRPGSRDLRQLRRLAGYLRPYRWRVVATIVALALAAAAVLVFGIGLRYLIDGGFTAGRSGALDHALKAALIVIVVLAAATFARAYLVAWLGERLVADLRAEVYARVTALSPAFFELTRTGEVLSRLTTDTAVIQAVISASLSQALRNLLLLVGGLALLVVTNPKLTGLVLIVVPLVVVPIVVIGRRVRRLSRRAQDRIGALSGHAEETLNAIRTVQAFSQEQRERRRFGGLVEQAFGAAVGHARARAALAGCVITLVFGAIVVVLWIGGQDVLGRPDHRRRARGLRVLRLGGGERDRRLERDHGRSAACRRGHRAPVRAARHDARDHRAGAARRLAGAGARARCASSG